MNIDIVLLAAGAGTRMHSSLPKVLQPLAGKPLIGHIYETVQKMTGKINLHVITGHESEQVTAYCKTLENPESIQFRHQKEQLGTGHAVIQALPGLQREGITVVLYGDVPLISEQTIHTLIQQVTEDSMALLTQRVENPTGYGRIIRRQGAIVAIVEEKDADQEQQLIKEINTGIMAINNEHLSILLPKINNKNSQSEYYLTDLIELAVNHRVTVKGYSVENPIEVEGVNNKLQLSQLERAYQQQQAKRLMGLGATLVDYQRFDIRGNVTVGSDVYIDVNCIFQGQVTLGNRVNIGPNCIIGEMGKTVEIGHDVEIKANSIIESGIIEKECIIGPFARIRPETHLKSQAKIGNFVEIKKSTVGTGSKVNHLSYIGDSTLGESVNIGAGTITCNYDGVNKYSTYIGDQAFIGSNTSLVAPVTIGNRSTVAAGSTITKAIDDDELAIARSKQRNIDNWPRPEKK